MPACKSCGAEIAWVRTDAGKMMPIDIDVEVMVEKDGERIVVAKTHWGTCPYAAEHKKRKGER